MPSYQRLKGYKISYEILEQTRVKYLWERCGIITQEETNLCDFFRNKIEDLLDSKRIRTPLKVSFGSYGRPAKIYSNYGTFWILEVSNEIASKWIIPVALRFAELGL